MVDSATLADPIGVYAILDANYVAPHRLPFFAEAFLRAGVRMFQLRAKGFARVQVERWATELLALVHDDGGILVVNDHVVVAARVGADGAHVGRDDMDPRQAREVLGAGKVLGISADSLEGVVRATDAGCDYVGFGPVFQTTTKATIVRPHGLSGLARACRATERPVVAIGGISVDQVTRVAEAGASGVAMISGLLASEGEAYARAVAAVEGFWRGWKGRKADTGR